MNDANSYSRQTLEDTPTRVISFLRGVGTSSVIRGALGARGYSPEDHTQGWELLHKVAGYGGGKDTSTQSESVRKAIVEIDAWDEPTFRIANAALERLHPEQAAFVFANLEPATGAAAVLTVKTFLERLTELESGADRQSTRDADHAALDTLARRGITKAERERMQTLLNLAQALESGTLPVDPTAEARYADLIALRAWFDDWSETARAAITRRDHLIRLGLAKRKTKTKTPTAETNNET